MLQTQPLWIHENLYSCIDWKLLLKHGSTVAELNLHIRSGHKILKIPVMCWTSLVSRTVISPVNFSVFKLSYTSHFNICTLHFSLLYVAVKTIEKHAMTIILQLVKLWVMIFRFGVEVCEGGPFANPFIQDLEWRCELRFCCEPPCRCGEEHITKQETPDCAPGTTLWVIHF